MIILPIGHDQSVYGKQWVLRVLIALNVLVFAYTYFAERSADEKVHDAIEVLIRTLDEHPDGRVPAKTLASLPPKVRTTLQPIVAQSAADLGDEDSFAVERAVKRLVDALEAKPSFRFGYRPGRPRLLGFVMSPFMHADIMHLLGNLLFLWLAGAVIECFWETIPFLILYVGSASAGTIAHHISGADSLIPLVGASGAISGLLGAFLVGHPKTQIRLFYFIWVRVGTAMVPAWALIPGWFALQVGYALLDPSGDVAHAAHVGGFIAGVAGAFVMRWGNWVYYDAERELKARSSGPPE